MFEYVPDKLELTKDTPNKVGKTLRAGDVPYQSDRADILPRPDLEISFVEVRTQFMV